MMAVDAANQSKERTTVQPRHVCGVCARNESTTGFRVPITGSKIIANDEEFVSEYAFRSEVWQDGDPKCRRSNGPVTDKRFGLCCAVEGAFGAIPILIEL
jgi:hypothetical protein